MNLRIIFAFYAFFSAITILPLPIVAQNVGIGTSSPDPTAKLDVSSTTSGFLPPRLTLAQRNAINNPAPGLIVYCIECNALQFFNGTVWKTIDFFDLPMFSSQIGSDIDGEAGGDQFGFSVALSEDGNILAAGAPFNGAYKGHVRVYLWNGNTWSQLGSDIDGEFAGDQSGTSVSLSYDGSTLAIGAPSNDGNGTDAGHVRVYHWSGIAWIQLGSDIDGEFAGDQSGTSVSLSANGNTLAIGAPYNDGFATDAGHTRVYHWNGLAWVQLGADINGINPSGLGGYSVSLSADSTTLAVGAQQASSVDIYRWNGSNWVQLGSEIWPGGISYGQSVSLSADGNIMVAGGAWSPTEGRVIAYEWTGTTWQIIGTTFSMVGSGILGYSVSVSADGTTIVCGAPYSSAGYSRVYKLISNPTTHWIQEGPDINGEATGDQSGFGVAIAPDGSTIVLGAPHNTSVVGSSGHVRVFR